jgi:uncharacterized protein (UPF0332 family)
MTPAQSSLLQKAQASVRAARLLSDQKLYDFAVSRAYYAMFYVAEAFLLGEGLMFSKHSAVIAAFGKYLVKNRHIPAKFHRYLIDGEDSRKVGDYDVSLSLSEDEAWMQIQRAEEFLELAEQHIGPIPERQDEDL